MGAPQLRPRRFLGCGFVYYLPILRRRITAKPWRAVQKSDQRKKWHSVSQVRKAVAALLLIGHPCCLLAWLFDHGEQVNAKLPRIGVGTSSAEVRALLGALDTSYVREEGARLQVMQYDMGLLAPDDMRVFVDHDSVTIVIYNL